MSFRNFTTGQSHGFGGTYLKRVPGEMTVTVRLTTVSVGTEMTVVQENMPDVIPADACYLGWQAPLRKLAGLVEPEIA